MNDLKTLAPQIAISSLRRSYGNVDALKGITLEIQKNSICGLLGSNGAGKTTLMALIAGHDRPTGGRLLVGGKEPFESEWVAANTSFIRDNQRYPDDYRLAHVLKTARYFHPNWDQELAQNLVEQFGLPAKTAVRKYSRGQLSALAIIVGIASRAAITILDEPYLGLDISARQRFYDVLLRDLAEHPRTVIVSTHLVEEMEAMFDQIVVLHQGQVVLDSTPEELAQSALEFSGRSDLVDAATEDLHVLSKRTVGSLGSAVVTGEIDENTVAKAKAQGISVKAASIHDLVAAIGSTYEETGKNL